MKKGYKTSDRKTFVSGSWPKENGAESFQTIRYLESARREIRYFQTAILQKCRK